MELERHKTPAVLSTSRESKFRRTKFTAYSTGVSQICFDLIKKDLKTGQLTVALKFREEEPKFLWFIKADAWQEDILYDGNRLVTSLLFEKKTTIYEGYDNDAQDSLIEAFGRKYPVLVLY